MNDTQARLDEVLREARVIADDTNPADGYFDWTLFDQCHYDERTSPVEKMLVVALVAKSLRSSTGWVVYSQRVGAYYPDAIVYQSVLLKHFRFRANGTPELCERATGFTFCIEVDGHDFHDRTKEQAERDRKRDRTLMRKDQMATIRFTGSEVWRDPFACADEVDAICKGYVEHILSIDEQVALIPLLPHELPA